MLASSSREPLRLRRDSLLTFLLVSSLAACSRVELSNTPAEGARPPVDASTADADPGDFGTDTFVDRGDAGVDIGVDLAVPDLGDGLDAGDDGGEEDGGVLDGGDDGGIGPVGECTWAPRGGRVALSLGDELGPATYDVEGESALVVIRNTGSRDVRVGIVPDDPVEPRRIAVDDGMSPITQLYGAGVGFVLARESCFAQGARSVDRRLEVTEGAPFASGPCAYGAGRGREGIAAISETTRALQFTSDAADRPTGARLGESFVFDTGAATPLTRILMANEARTLAHRFDPAGRGSRFRAADGRMEVDTRTLSEVVAVAPEGRDRGTLVLTGPVPGLLRYPAAGGEPEVLDLPPDLELPDVPTLVSGSRHALLVDDDLTLHAIPLVPGLMRQEIALSTLLGETDSIRVRQVLLVSHAPTDSVGVVALRESAAGRDASWRAFRCRE